MSDDQDLLEWGIAHARRTDPDTSHEAACSIDGEVVTRLESIVEDFIRSKGSAGATGHEIIAATGLPNETVTPRTRPLVEKGRIVNSGEKRVAPSGRRQIVWKHSIYAEGVTVKPRKKICPHCGGER